MCKLHNCFPDNPCHYCKRQAERAKKKPIPKRTDKRAKIDRVYNARVKVWKVENPLCMARLDGCMRITTDCHHIEPRTEKNLLIEENWMPVCPPCHRRITDDSNNAIEKGLSKSRLKN